MPDRIYLDHAATTPMRPEARAAVAEGMARWANPSSPHAEGRAARAMLERARARIKAALGWDGELIFTSGASEALAIAMTNAVGSRRFVSAVEHDAVFRAAPDATVLPIETSKLTHAVDAEVLAAMLHGTDRPIVAIQSVNSETGIVQPLDVLGGIVRRHGGLLVADCSQSAGKWALPDADLLIVSAHKLGGPPGIGALLVRDFAMLRPTGGQEFGYRSGTENLPAAMGFAAAVEAWRDEPEQSRMHRIAAFNDFDGAMDDSTPFFGAQSQYIHAIPMPGMSAQAQLIRFDAAGFAVSAGSACSSGTLKPSRTLLAFGLAPEVAARTIRVSFGWSTTRDELERFARAWHRLAAEASSRAA